MDQLRDAARRRNVQRPLAVRHGVVRIAPAHLRRGLGAVRRGRRRHDGQPAHDNEHVDPRRRDARGERGRPLHVRERGPRLDGDRREHAGGDDPERRNVHVVPGARLQRHDRRPAGLLASALGLRGHHAFHHCDSDSRRLLNVRTVRPAHDRTHAGPGRAHVMTPRRAARPDARLDRQLQRPRADRRRDARRRRQGRQAVVQHGGQRRRLQRRAGHGHRGLPPHDAVSELHVRGVAAPPRIQRRRRPDVPRRGLQRRTLRDQRLLALALQQPRALGLGRLVVQRPDAAGSLVGLSDVRPGLQRVGSRRSGAIGRGRQQRDAGAVRQWRPGRPGSFPGAPGAPIS